MISSWCNARQAGPYAFTEKGVAIRSSVLRRWQACHEVNTAIMRAFVKLHEMLKLNEELNRKFAAVACKLSAHDEYFRIPV